MLCVEIAVVCDVSPNFYSGVCAVLFVVKIAGLKIDVFKNKSVAVMVVAVICDEACRAFYAVAVAVNVLLSDTVIRMSSEVVVSMTSRVMAPVTFESPLLS